jgi:hypothetical protein
MSRGFDPDTECPHRLLHASTAVEVHPRHVEVTVQARPLNATIQLRTHAGVDHAVQHLLFGYAQVWTYNPVLVVLGSLTPVPHDGHDNQLRLDCDLSAGLAAVAYTTLRPAPRTWYSRGRRHPTPAHRLCWDYHDPHASAFPADAAVPAELVARIVHEIWDLGGAGLPACVDWQNAPQVTW